MAKEERDRHREKYPTWSARDNYAIHKKKKVKVRRERTEGELTSYFYRIMQPTAPRPRHSVSENGEIKKCRARYGLESQAQWCKHCKRKKRCLWYRQAPGSNSTGAASTEELSPPQQVTSTTSGGTPEPCKPNMQQQQQPNGFNIAALTAAQHQHVEFPRNFPQFHPFGNMTGNGMFGQLDLGLNGEI